MGGVQTGDEHSMAARHGVREEMDVSRCERYYNTNTISDEGGYLRYIHFWSSTTGLWTCMTIAKGPVTE